MTNTTKKTIVRGTTERAGTHTNYVHVPATDTAWITGEPAVTVSIPRDKLHWFDPAGRRHERAADMALETR